MLLSNTHLLLFHVTTITFIPMIFGIERRTIREPSPFGTENKEEIIITVEHFVFSPFTSILVLSWAIL